MSTEKTIIYPPIFVMESHADRILSSRASEKGRNCLGSACSSTTAKDSAADTICGTKGAAQCGKDRKKQTDLRHFRLFEALYCHIPGQKRRTDIVTEGKQVFSFGRRNFPLSVRSEQDFAPTGKPQRNPQTTEKEAFSEMPRKGFRIGERVWLIRKCSLCGL